MGQRSFSDQEITEYLLGSVSETEEFDQLSVTDDEFAVRLEAVENDLVDAYVRGELSGKTLANFESNYLSSQRRRAKVLNAQGLKDMLEPAKESAFPSKARWNWRNFFVPKFGLQMGLAAAFLLALAAGSWLAISNFRLQQQASQAKLELENLQSQRSSDAQKDKEIADLRGQIARLEQQATPVQPKPGPSRAVSPNIFSFALSPQLRGTGKISTVAIPATADLVALKLELEAGNYADYRAELKTEPGNQSVWKSGKLRPIGTGTGSDKVVILSLRPNLMKNERYRVELSGVSPEGKLDMIGSYLFMVSR